MVYLKEVQNNLCSNCNLELQTYYEKPDGDKIITYKRCTKCLEIYVEVKNGGLNE